MALAAIEVQTLQSVESAARKRDRSELFACLAARRAAVRAAAAETLLERHGRKRVRGGLARDFGKEPGAVMTPLFAELADAIGYQPSPAWLRFQASLSIGHEEWRDGIGHDLAALAAMHPEERAVVGQWLRSRLTDAMRAIDWRELEAAEALGDTAVLRSLARHPDRDVRLRVARLLDEGADAEKELCRVLREAGGLGELARAAALVPSYRTAAVKRAMIARLRKADGYFVSVAMTLLQVFAGKDGWAERPFLFRVKEAGARGPLMRELLEKVGA